MKIKDILGETEVTLKPMPGAQEIDMDGKPIGTATTPDAANAIADLAKKGEFTALDPNKPTSEDQGTADTIRSAFTSALTSSDLSPEEQQAAQTLIVKDENGKIDADKTLINSLKSMPKMAVEILDAFDTLSEYMEKYVAGAIPDEPAFATLSPDAQQKMKQDMVDLKSACNSSRQKLQAMQPELDKSIGQLQTAMGKYPQQESHKDTIAQGGGDVGGDPTDRFIDQVRDKGYERKNRGYQGASTRSALSEKDELYKWLTIAGIK